MSSPAELFRVGLMALLTGIAIPLLVQLFLVLRNLQRMTGALDRRVEQSLRDLGEAVAEIKRGSASTASFVPQLVAAVPAMFAAVRAFRAGVAHDSPSPSPSNNTHTQEKHA